MSRSVEVLLSTYNGARHLDVLVESVLAQEGVDVGLTVRDDGSTDTTVEILRRYADRGRLRLSAGPNLGVPDAFFEMLDAADPAVDYVALCDQDDVWLPDKLSRAVDMLAGEPRDEAVLYCARVLLVDENLQTLFPHPLPRRGPSFENALVQNIATGCTIVLNAAALSLVRGRRPVGVPIHDWWLYLVVSGAGRVLYDPSIVAWYRQHDANTIGMRRTGVQRAAGRVRRHLGGWGQPSRQALELRRLHDGDLRPGQRATLERFLESRASIGRRLRYAAAPDAVRQTTADDLIFRALYALGRV